MPTEPSASKLALCVNPMSGRDVRRLAARATNMTHEAKRDIVCRVAAGADAVGITDIYIAQEPFRIASLALEHMDLKARVHLLKHPIRNDATDTETNVRAFMEAGCQTIVSLGGDGTNRAIVRSVHASREFDNNHLHLMPLSTGTNNVFPVLVEPTIAGMAAGLQARGLVPDQTDLKQRAKVLHVRLGGKDIDLGLIDAVLLRNDHVGNLLPFDSDRIARIALTRAEPASIGMSPIGGLLKEVTAADEEGMLLDIGGDDPFVVPLSPGLFAPISVAHHEPMAMGAEVEFAGPGVMALDGDRDHKITADQPLTVQLRRDGPWVLQAEAIMRWAVTAGIMRRVLA